MTHGNIVELAPNQPQLVAIKYAAPKIVANGRAMFSLIDGRILFVDPPIAEQIIALGLRTGEPFAICLRWSGKKTAPKTYDVWRESDAAEPLGEQTDGTFAVPAVQKSGANGFQSSAPLPKVQEESAKAVCGAVQGNGFKPGQPRIAPTTTSLAQSAWSLQMRDETNTLVGIFADCCSDAKARYHGAVSNDDVRSLLMNRIISGGRR